MDCPMCGLPTSIVTKDEAPDDPFWYCSGPEGCFYTVRVLNQLEAEVENEILMESKANED